MAKDTKGKGSVEQGLIRELAGLLEETGLSEIEIEREGLRVRVARQMSVQAGRDRRSPAASARSRRLRRRPPLRRPRPPRISASIPAPCKSPMVGTAYLAARARRPAVRRDRAAKVTQGQTILIIEAMKTMNHIPAPKAGVVTAILVGNGQPVEFGELLAIIE